MKKTQNSKLKTQNSKILSILKESIQVKKKLLGEDFLLTLEKMVKIAKETLKKKGKIFICGNGGSAADSQHFATELVGRFKKERKGIPAISLASNSPLLTAISNDYSFGKVFSRQLEALGRSNDLLIAISTSGKAKNVISAAKTAKEMGIKTIGLSGKDGGELKDIVDLPFIVPSSSTPRIQEAHITILHILAEFLEE